MILNSPYISGSLIVTANGTVSGSLTVLGGITGAITGSATSASYAISASEASTLQGLGSASFAPAATFNTVSQSYAASSASLSTRVTNEEATSSVLTAASSSFAIMSGSLSTRVTNVETTASVLTLASSSFAVVSSSFATASGSLSTRVTNLETTSSTVSQSFASTSGSISGRVTLIEGQYATTGSNVFTGPQFINQASNAISFTSTASLYTDGGLRVGKDSFVSGTAYFNNVVIYGTSSVQYITSSQVNFGTNIITVNTDTPAVRFGGLAVFDSGSTGLTGSILWDSQANHWVYSNPSGSTYSGGMIMSGPRAASLGTEQGTTSCALMMGQGGDHITSSAIFSYGNATCFYGTTVVGSGGTVCSTMINASCVGIGTTTPANTLDVTGTGRFTGIVTFGSTGGSGLRVYGAAGTNQWDMYLNGANLRFSDNTGTGSVVFDRSISGTSATFSGDLTLSSGGDRIFNINDTGGNLFQIQAASNILYYSARTTGGSLAFRTNGTNDVKLSIASTGAATFSASQTDTGGVIGALNVTNNTSGNVINAILPSATSTDAIFYRAQTVGAGADDKYFFVGQTGNGSAITTNRVLITTNGAAIFSSSVTANARSFIKGSAGYLFDVEEQSSNKARFQSYVASNEVSLVAGYDTTAVPMTFYTGLSERMRITSDGYVAVTGNQALKCVPYLQGMSFGWNRTNGQGESMINWTNAGGGIACDLTFNFRDSSTLYERMRLDASGNLGLGVTPSIWTLGKAIEIGNLGHAIWSVNATQYNIMYNTYYNGGFVYASSNPASYYQQASGNHTWYNAPSGTAGCALTFCPAMALNACSRLLVGSGVTDSGASIQTNGDIRTDYSSAIYLQINGGAAGDYRKGFSGVNQQTGVARGLHIFNYDPDSNQGIKFFGGTFASRVRFGGFDNGGNFFVNSTDSAEGYKFYVNGTAGITGAATFLSSIAATSGTFTAQLAASLTSSGIPLRIDVSTGPNVTSNTKFVIGTGGQAGSQANKKFLDIDFNGFANTPQARIRSWDESASTGQGTLDFYTNPGAVDANVLALRLAPAGAATFSSLSGSGSRTVTADAFGTLSASSDSSLKQEDTTHKIEGLAEILQLQPRAYKWLSDIEIRGEEAVTEIGFFANEVNPIIPSAAPKGNDDLYGFYDRAVIAALVKGMQEQQAQIEALKARIETLEK